MEYVTKKIPKDAEPLLNEFQAMYILKVGEKLTEGKAVKKALEYAIEHVNEQRPKKRYRLRDFCGVIKDGPKSNAAEDVDRVVYGI